MKLLFFGLVIGWVILSNVRKVAQVTVNTPIGEIVIHPVEGGIF